MSNPMFNQTGNPMWWQQPWMYSQGPDNTRMNVPPANWNQPTNAPVPVNLPTTQPTQQPLAGLPCKVITSGNDILPNEVSMNGEPSVFVMRDLSEIHIKQWNSNGGIDTVTYKPVIPAPEPAAEPQPSQEYISIMDKLNDLTELVAKLPVTNNNRNNNNKKGGNGNADTQTQ